MTARIFATTKASEVKHTCTNSRKQNPNFNSSGSSADRILQLQRTVGNQAMQRLLASDANQTKLAINNPGGISIYKNEHVMGQVMRMPVVLAHKKNKTENESTKAKIRTTLQGGPEAATPCTYEQMQSLKPVITRAIAMVFKAFSRLQSVLTGGFASSIVEKQLWNHFHIRPNSSHALEVLNVMRGIYEILNSTPLFYAAT
jgi:hypothetical protein